MWRRRLRRGEGVSTVIVGVILAAEVVEDVDAGEVSRHTWSMSVGVRAK